MDFNTMSNEALAAALTEKREAAKALFALDSPTIEQVNEAEALLASIRQGEAVEAERAAAVKDAAKRFAAAKQSFAVNDGVESSDDEDEDGDGDEDDEDDESDESEDGDDEDNEDDESEESEVEAAAKSKAETTDEKDAPPFEKKKKKVTPKDEEVTTASAIDHTTSQRVKPTAARKVGRKTRRPAVQASAPVTITAASDVPGFSTSQPLADMEQVTKALLNRTKGFAPFNLQAAKTVASQSGGQPVLSKFGVASFGIPMDAAVTASAQGDDYSAVRNAIKARMGGGAEDALSAAGWCAPSENVYSYIADYVVDGLVTVPEVNAPRGGLNITTGPARSSQGAALDDFGFVQTETQAEAGTVKTCETIVCPDFVDHRLDAIGYCYKIPLLTQKAYPELITDALRFANVLYAHKVNKRVLSDMVALSTAVTFTGYGATFTDSLEALAQIAVAERRKWNVGRTAVMEVKVPEFALEVYRADMSRRNGIAKDSVSDGDIARHFADRHLAVEYVADWQETAISAGALVIPGTITALIYPSGTFVKAIEDVVNLSAVYDAASLSVNEYTGVFFEQGILVAKAGYGASKVSIPVNSAGEQGALDLTEAA